MAEFDFNIQETEVCCDPHDNLGPIEWVDKQLEYNSNEAVVSGRGIVPVLNSLKGSNLVGCEIGVCYGFTTEYFLKNVANISRIYAVDPYPSFIDWNGTRVTKERQQESKYRCLQKLNRFGSRVIFAYEDSSTFASKIADASLDFVFIDGNHSYEAVLRDCQLYWPKVKTGGVFSGHDYGMTTVNKALCEYFKVPSREYLPVTKVENDAWYMIK